MEIRETILGKLTIEIRDDDKKYSTIAYVTCEKGTFGIRVDNVNGRRHTVDGIKFQTIYDAVEYKFIAQYDSLVYTPDSSIVPVIRKTHRGDIAIISCGWAGASTKVYSVCWYGEKNSRRIEIAVRQKGFHTWYKARGMTFDDDFDAVVVEFTYQEVENE